jgi:hypothetical protein
MELFLGKRPPPINMRNMTATAILVFFAASTLFQASAQLGGLGLRLKPPRLVTTETAARIIASRSSSSVVSDRINFSRAACFCGLLSR